MADIEIVRPIAGARRVSFGYDAASAALDAIWEAIAAANQRQRELNDEREQQLAGVPHGAI
jgi:hypothetical protein